MWKISCKPSIVTVLLVIGLQHNGVFAKECFSCEGINCLRTSKVNATDTCTDAMDNCVTIFEESTIIAKGCYTKLPAAYRRKCDDNSNGKCLTCYTSLCNDKGAISCLQCNSKQNTDCSGDISNIASSRCPASTSPNSYCYTRQSSDHIERSCLINSVEQVKCLADSSCSMCLPSSEDDSCNREIAINAPESGASQIAFYGTLTALSWFVIAIF